MQKYELVKSQIENLFEGRKVFRIRAIKDFDGIRAGTLGGFVESEENLSQEGDSWIFDDSVVMDNAKVCGDAQVTGASVIKGNAIISGNALIHNSCLADSAVVAECATVRSKKPGYVMITGNAAISGNAKIRSWTDIVMIDGFSNISGSSMIGNKSVIGGITEISGEAIISNAVVWDSIVTDRAYIANNEHISKMIVGDSARIFSEHDIMSFTVDGHTFTFYKNDNDEIYVSTENITCLAQNLLHNFEEAFSSEKYNTIMDAVERILN